MEMTFQNIEGKVKNKPSMTSMLLYKSAKKLDGNSTNLFIHLAFSLTELKRSKENEGKIVRLHMH